MHRDILPLQRVGDYYYLYTVLSSLRSISDTNTPNTDGYTIECILTTLIHTSPKPAGPRLPRSNSKSVPITRCICVGLSTDLNEKPVVWMAGMNQEAQCVGLGTGFRGFGDGYEFGCKQLDTAREF